MPLGLLYIFTGPVVTLFRRVILQPSRGAGSSGPPSSEETSKEKGEN
ncbi:MAG: hypothetical protein LBF22_01030 [Deltaproteobacteria bacterium]|nr:hypothetical protein [Deltaproteobacteria bacterium]